MINFAKIQHIFFDLDHTLWDFDANSKLAFQKIFEEDFKHINLDDFLDKYLYHNQECWKLYQVNLISHEELRYNRLKFTFDEMELMISDESIDYISEKYIDLLPQSNLLFEGCVETLDYLKEKYQLHIITNGFAQVQKRKMQNSSIRHYFKTIVNSEDAGAKKPSSQIFEFALKNAEANIQNSIMIGDSLEADIEGAQNIGLPTIYFNPNQKMHTFETIEISHLLELKKWL